MKKVTITETAINYIVKLVKTQSCAPQDWDTMHQIDSECKLADEIANAERKDGCIIVSDEAAGLIRTELSSRIADLIADYDANVTIEDEQLERANVTKDAIALALIDNGISESSIEEMTIKDIIKAEHKATQDILDDMIQDAE